LAHLFVHFFFFASEEFFVLIKKAELELANEIFHVSDAFCIHVYETTLD
jgi:hypothetical protein